MKILRVNLTGTKKAMKKIVIAIALCVLCLASCIKDEAKNKECDIESAWIEGEEYEQYFYQKTDMYKDVSSTETVYCCPAVNETAGVYFR